VNGRQSPASVARSREFITSPHVGVKKRRRVARKTGGRSRLRRTGDHVANKRAVARSRKKRVVSTSPTPFTPRQTFGKRSHGQGTCKLRNEHQRLELEPRGHHRALRRRDVVLVGAADLLDEAVAAQPLDHPRDLSSGLVQQVASDVRVAQGLDRVLAAKDDFEESDVFVREEVESAVAATRLLDLVADPSDGGDLPPGFRSLSITTAGESRFANGRGAPGAAPPSIASPRTRGRCG